MSVASSCLRLRSSGWSLFRSLCMNLLLACTLTRFSELLHPTGNQFSGQRLFDSLDIRTQCFEALMQSLVASVYGVHVAKHGLPFRGEHTDKQERGGAKRGRGFDIRRMQVCR